jgi:hypothetical protein
MIESILTSSDRRQLWTLSTHNDSTKEGQIASSFLLEETCSVNVLLKREPGPFFSLDTIFGVRVISPSAIVILVLSPSHREAGMKFGKGYFDFLLTHLFLIILGPGVSSGIEESFVSGGRCSTIIFPVRAPIKATHLLAMRAFSEEVRRDFHPRTLLAGTSAFIIQCPVGYPEAFSYLFDGKHTICSPRNNFLQQLALRLNSTLEFNSFASSRGVLHSGRKTPTGIVTVDTLAWYPFGPSVLQFYLRDTYEIRFLYCARGVERESFSFLFLGPAL